MALFAVYGVGDTMCGGGWWRYLRWGSVAMFAVYGVGDTMCGGGWWRYLVWGVGGAMCVGGLVVPTVVGTTGPCFLRLVLGFDNFAIYAFRARPGPTQSAPKTTTKRPRVQTPVWWCQLWLAPPGQAFCDLFWGSTISRNMLFEPAPAPKTTTKRPQAQPPVWWCQPWLAPPGQGFRD